eukprot:TRINITY_DN43834_c0_g1_i1.p1 TRINITY_DN43834_c0_g1~~TRINITY_DN43834_c0_g1_i1.p1  ORF type:complete len:220 (-),score=24.77 TRINITY_DN43834_c0_g1_i1:96-755(-)
MGRSRSRSPPSVRQAGGCDVVALSFDAAEHAALRCRGRRRVVGLPIGTLPSNPQQNAQLGAPFVIFGPQIPLVEAVAPNERIDRVAASNDTVDPSLAHGGTVSEEIHDASGILANLAENQSTAIANARDVVFRDLTKRGYWVLPGFRHGFDLVLYEGDPVRHHGAAFVIVVDASRDIRARELVLWNRLAASARKSAILATVDVCHTGMPKYLLISGEER